MAYGKQKLSYSDFARGRADAWLPVLEVPRTLQREDMKGFHGCQC